MRSPTEFRKAKPGFYPDQAVYAEFACAEFGLRYNTHRNFFAAVASHFRWLQRMGQPDINPST